MAGTVPHKPTDAADDVAGGRAMAPEAASVRALAISENMRRAIALVPPSVMVRFGILPLDGVAPSRDATSDECGYLRFLCTRRLTDDERRSLCVRLPRYSLRFVDSHDAEFQDHKESIARFWEILEAQAPREEAAVLGAEQIGAGESAR